MKAVYSKKKLRRRKQIVVHLVVHTLSPEERIPALPYRSLSVPRGYDNEFTA